MTRREPKFLVLEHVTPATRLMEKRRQMFQVQETLDAQKSDFAHKEEIFKVSPWREPVAGGAACTGGRPEAPSPVGGPSRVGGPLSPRPWRGRPSPRAPPAPEPRPPPHPAPQRDEEEVKRRDMNLQESLIKFSNFLQENEKKRSQHDKKAREESKQSSKHLQESGELMREIAALEQKREQVIRVLETQMLAYMHFLEHTLEVADAFHDIHQISDRYRTLESTHAENEVKNQKLRAQHEETRVEMTAFVNNKTNEIQSLRNRIANLKKEQEKVEQDVRSVEVNRDSEMVKLSEGMLQNGSVCMAAANLYARCCKNSNISHPPDEANTLHQLEIVGHFVSDLGEIIKKYRQEQQAATKEKERDKLAAGGAGAAAAE